MSIKLETENLGIDISNVAAVGISQINEMGCDNGKTSYYRTLRLTTEDGHTLHLTMSAHLIESLFIEGDFLLSEDLANET